MAKTAEPKIIEMVTPAGRVCMPAKEARAKEGKDFKRKDGSTGKYEVLAIDGHPAKKDVDKKAAKKKAKKS